MIVSQNVAFCRINNDAGTQAFKRLGLLVGRLIAKIFFQFFRDALALYRRALNLNADHRRQHFFQHGCEAWNGRLARHLGGKGGKYRDGRRER